MMITGVVGGDVCVDPSSAVAKIMNVTSVSTNVGGPDATNTLVYYTSCQNQDGTINPPTSGALLQLSLGQQDFSSLQTNFATFSQQYANQAPYTAAVASVNGALSTATASLTTLNSYSSCLALNSVWQTMVTSLCNTGISQGILNVWALSTAACVLMFFLATSASRICWRHPGDPVEDNENSGLVVVYNAASGRGKGEQTAVSVGGGPSTVGSGPQYSALPAAPTSAATSAASGRAGAYASSEWR